MCPPPLGEQIKQWVRPKRMRNTLGAVWNNILIGTSLLICQWEREGGTPPVTYVTLRYDTLCYVTLWYVMLRYVMIWYDTIRYVTLRTNPFELKLIWGTVLLFWHNSCIKMHFWIKLYAYFIPKPIVAGPISVFENNCGTSSTLLFPHLVDS